MDDADRVAVAFWLGIGERNRRTFNGIRAHTHRRESLTAKV
jgi:hypothetical protein